MVTVTACGGVDATTVGDAPGAGPPPATDPVDGRLTTPTGEVITDYGDPRQSRAAVRILDRLQQDFRAGRMRAACSKINDFLLGQFTPRGTDDETPCPEKLEAYAAARTRRSDQAEQLRLLWVRSYTGRSGIWVDNNGDRLRIQLSDRPPHGLQLDLGALNHPDVLAARLVGAADYVKP